MGQKPFRQVPFPGPVQQHRSLKHRRLPEGRKPPVIGNLPSGQRWVHRKTGTLSRKLAVKARLVLGPERIGERGAFRIAKGFVGPAFPIPRASKADRRFDRRPERPEMPKRGVRVIKIGQRQIARQPFEIGIGIPVRRRHPV